MADIIPRSAWTSRPNTADRVSEPYNEVVLHTEAGAVLPGDWATLTAAAAVLSLTEKEHVAAVDRYHREVRGWDDGIGYNFFIERDGTIIEGRGWGRKGAHTQKGRNTTAVGFCFAGHGDLQAATQAQWLAARALISDGIKGGHLRPDYAVNGHRAYAQKSCPGNLVFPHIDRLKGVRPGSEPTTPGAPRTILRNGDRGEDVRFLQGMLNIITPHARLGNRKPLTEDGIYGNATTARVLEFEKWSNAMSRLAGKTTGLLQQDGVVTEHTLRAIAFWVGTVL